MSDLKSAYRQAQPRKPVRDIATKAELDKRLIERPKPAVVRHLTPNGIEERAVRTQVNNQAEDRIKQLRSRLDTAHDRLREGVKYTQHHGRAKRDFEAAR